MLDFAHLRTREAKRAAVLRDMLDVTVREYLTGSDGERIEYEVTVGDECRLVMHLQAHDGRWGQA